MLLETNFTKSPRLMEQEVSSIFDLKASHYLEGYGDEHMHNFEIEVGVIGMALGGMVFDLFEFRKMIIKLLEPLQGSSLSQKEELPAFVRTYPTCESLIQLLTPSIKESVAKIKAHYPLRLSYIKVSLWDEHKHTCLGTVKQKFSELAYESQRL